MIAIESNPVTFDLVREKVRETQQAEQPTLDRFHQLSYHGFTWSMATWMGVPMLKHPCDAMMLQELVCRIKPALIIETGTAFGGSALFLAHVCDAIGHGAIVTIDLDPHPKAPRHPRITHRVGSSVDPEIVGYVSGRVIRAGGPVLVLLDSDHHQEHVFAELILYSPFVTLGSYLVVEDTNVNGNPILPEFGPGPKEAVDRFLDVEGGHNFFERDVLPERYLMTFHPGGWLRRIA